MVLEDTLQLPEKIQINTDLATNPKIYNGDLSAWYTNAIVAQKLWKKQISPWLDLRPNHEMEPIPNIARVAKNPRLDRPVDLRENQIILF